MTASPEEAVLYETRGPIAIITLNLPKKLNAMTQDYYFRISQLMRQAAADDKIYITVLTGKGRFFSAGADVSISRENNPNEDMYRQWLKNFVAHNLNITQAFYSHPKILVGALNGPAVGLSAALLGFADFIYAAPHTFLLTPFSSLGLVAEGGASRGLVQRLGIAKANEALIQSKRITCDELVHTGFVNKVIHVKPGEDAKFLDLVLKEIDDRMGDHLSADSMIKIKGLIRSPENDLLDAQGVKEVFGGLARFTSGIPQERFRQIASGERKHKL